jgi:Arc/MetJ-type ribon-helix-helix transcriptional regulator
LLSTRKRDGPKGIGALYLRGAHRLGRCSTDGEAVLPSKPGSLTSCIATQYIELRLKEEAYMERQLTLRMPANLATKLDKVARHTRRRRSEIVRLALEQFLGEADTKEERRPIELVRDLLGSMESGVPDLGQRHRDYLLKRLRRAH